MIDESMIQFSHYLRTKGMTVFGHPLFFVFAFTLLVGLAGIWWLLSERQARDDQEAPPPRDHNQSLIEVLQDVPPAPIPLAQPVPASPSAANPAAGDATQRIVKREETKTRLAVLDELIAKQRSRIASARTMGLDVTLLEEQLKVLADSREEYFSALKRLLGEFLDGRHGGDGNR